MDGASNIFSLLLGDPDVQETQTLLRSQTWVKGDGRDLKE